MKDNNKISFWLILTIALLSMVGPFTVDTYLPSFPAIESEFLINRTLLLQSIFFYLAASAISTLFWGSLSDRIGRRSVILSSLVLYILASLGCALASDYSNFLLFRIFQGIASGGGMVAGRAMVRDSHNDHLAHRVMAYIMMLFALAPAIAPIMGGWLHDEFGWRSVFYFLAIFAGLIFFMSAFILKETLSTSQRQSFHPLHVGAVYIKMLLHARFLILVLSLGFSFSGLFLYIAGSPTVIFTFLNLGSNDFAWLFIPMTAGIIVGSFASGKLAHHWSIYKINQLAFAIMFIGIFLNIIQAIWFVPAIIPLFLPLVVYSIGIALALPGFGILSIDCFPHNRGAASAVQSFVQVMFSAMMAGFVLPLLPESVLGFALGQSVCLLVALVLWRFIK